MKDFTASQSEPSVSPNGHGEGSNPDPYGVMDLFSAAAGGWSLGMHRAGFHTIAACEVEAWRRTLYSENNPHVRVYDDVRTLGADRLVRDLGCVPGIVVGSPPCQDISSANAKGRGVDGERSGLFFEAIRIVGECRARGGARWVALENSSNLRTKGSDRVLGALEDLGYACWPLVVRARDVGANHERPRVWIIACDTDQVIEGAVGGLLARPRSLSSGGASTDPHGHGRPAGRGRRRLGIDLSPPHYPEHPACLGHEGGRSRGHRPDGDRETSAAGRHDGDASQDGCGSGRSGRCALATKGLSVATRGDAAGSYANDEGQPDRTEHDEVGRSPRDGSDAAGPWAEWNGGLAGHLRVDDGLSTWVAGARVAVGGPRGTAAASLIVEAFGDAVVPQITEIIGRAILRTEAALAVALGCDQGAEVAA